MNALDKGHGISILVPFRADGTERQAIWNWLEPFYRYHLPEAQLIVGTEDGMPFSKTIAVNNAARIASGDVFVILDADCLIDPRIIAEAANNIRIARFRGIRRSYIPYRRLGRLTPEATDEVLEMNPVGNMHFDFDEGDDIDNCDESGVGQHFGALIQIMPREAFYTVGGMDERFRGWGGEDVSFVMALDTLYARHRTMNENVYTLFHEPKGRRHHRLWSGQGAEDPNGRHAGRYNSANGDIERMRALIEEQGYNSGS